MHRSLDAPKNTGLGQTIRYVAIQHPKDGHPRLTPLLKILRYWLQGYHMYGMRKQGPWKGGERERERETYTLREDLSRKRERDTERERERE